MGRPTFGHLQCRRWRSAAERRPAMGYSNWSDAAYQARQQNRDAANETAFTYDAHVRASGVVSVHPAMDPRCTTRESRDSAVHADSVAIAVIFDVTGSMGHVPRV